MNFLVKIWKTLRGQYTVVEDRETVYEGIIFARDTTMSRNVQFHALLTKVSTFYKIKKFLTPVSDRYDLLILEGLIPEKNVRIVSVDNIIIKRKVYK